ncbi:hypothetical protein AAMO2058_001269300 [Amorphochlora amoebiformis]
MTFALILVLTIAQLVCQVPFGVQFDEDRVFGVVTLEKFSSSMDVLRRFLDLTLEIVARNLRSHIEYIKQLSHRKLKGTPARLSLIHTLGNVAKLFNMEIVLQRILGQVGPLKDAVSDAWASSVLSANVQFDVKVPVPVGEQDVKRIGAIQRKIKADCARLIVMV